MHRRGHVGVAVAGVDLLDQPRRARPACARAARTPRRAPRRWSRGRPRAASSARRAARRGDIGEPSSWRAASSIASTSSPSCAVAVARGARRSSRRSARRPPRGSARTRCHAAAALEHRQQRGRPRTRTSRIRVSRSRSASSRSPESSPNTARRMISSVSAWRRGCSATGSSRGQRATSRSATSCISPESRCIFSPWKAGQHQLALAEVGAARRAGSPSSRRPPARGSARPRRGAAPRAAR